MSLPPADTHARRARSLRSLQTIQRNAREILEDASYVALYRFLEDDQKWIRMDIEGACFVTKNDGKPSHTFVILNKIGTQDLVLQIEEDILKVKVQDKYVMMQCIHSEGRVIFGLWFHQSAERQRTYDAIQKLILSKPTAPALRRVDIAAILSPSKPSETSADRAISDQNMANALTKSSQLLTLLKRGVENPPASSSQAPLEVAKYPLPSATSPEPSEKTKLLLALVRGAPPATLTTGSPLPTSPMRAVEARHGAELLTDGDIAQKLHALTVKPLPPSAAPAATSTTIIIKPQSPSAATAAPSAAVRPVPGSPALSSSLITPSALLLCEPGALHPVKPAKKSSVKLISPSDLEAF